MRHVLFVCAFLSLVASPLAADRPNFLLIVADDLCWRDLGFTGNKATREWKPR